MRQTRSNYAKQCSDDTPDTTPIQVYEVLCRELRVHQAFKAHQELRALQVHRRAHHPSAAPRALQVHRGSSYTNKCSPSHRNCQLLQVPLSAPSAPKDEHSKYIEYSKCSSKVHEEVLYALKLQHRAPSAPSAPRGSSRYTKCSEHSKYTEHSMASEDDANRSYCWFRITGLDSKSLSPIS